jgi:UDP-N-acetylmuramate dehydrogenase
MKGLRFLPKAPLSEWTSLRVGGVPRYFVEVLDEEGLHEVKKLEQPFRMLGRGSNLLVSDGGLPFGVVHLSGAFRKVSVPPVPLEDAVFLEAFSGAPLRVVSKMALKAHGSGLEFGITIPGSLGGAIRMNAGAHGQELGPLIKTLSVLQENDGGLKDFRKEDLEFTYRSFALKGFKSAPIFVKALLRLPKQNPKAIQERMQSFLACRALTQPSKVLSCGCIFKNPLPPAPSAGKLLDLSNLKGVSRGGATVSKVHANFFINLGHASASDFFGLIEMARERVFKDHGVELDLEVEVWKA